MNFQEFKTKYQKKPVEEYPNKVSENPLVSVCVQTYNHVGYIKKCLEGILMQETDFLFEILLGDDCSADGTREICTEYARKYPERIRLFLHNRTNNIKVAGKPTGRFNFLYNLYNATGKYVALCEGDDYWTDPLKLQKQVDIMEEKEDVTLTCGGFEIHSNEFFGRQVIHKLKQGKKGERGYYFNLRDTRSAWIPKTLTLTFRRDACDLGKLSRYQFMRDIHLSYEILKRGMGFYITETLGVYNVHVGGIHSGGDAKWKKDMHYNIFSELYLVNKDIHSKKLLNRYSLKLLSDKLYCKEQEKPSAPLSKLLYNSILLISDFKDVLFLMVSVLPEQQRKQIVTRVKTKWSTLKIMNS